MEKEKIIDLYTDFEIVSFENIEMTKLSKILGNGFSHDIFTKMLSKEIDTEHELLKKARPMLKNLDIDDVGMVIVDDTLIKKPYSKENELIAHYYDNSVKKVVKGINILNFLHTSINDSKKMLIPIGFEPIIKDEIYENDNFKEKRKSSITKNEIVRDKLKYFVKNNINFRYVVGDSWFASSENIEYISQKLNKIFVFRIKSSRLIAFSEKDRINGKFSKIRDIDMSAKKDCLVYLKGCLNPVRLSRLYVKNGTNFQSTDSYLITNDINLNIITLSEIYQKRWKVEEFHKSIKQNLKIERSPTKTFIPQLNHIFLTFLAFIKLEKFRTKFHTNHYNFKEQLYISALKEAMNKLKNMEKKEAS